MPPCLITERFDACRPAAVLSHTSVPGAPAQPVAITMSLARSTTAVFDSKDGFVQMLRKRQLGVNRASAMQQTLGTARTAGLELSSQKELRVAHEAGIHCLDVDPSEGRYLLSGSQDKSLAIHDLSSPMGHASEKHVCPAICTVAAGAVGGHKYSVETVQWYPYDSGMFITSAMDGAVKVWDTNVLAVATEFTNLPGGGVYDHTMSQVATHGLIAVACRHEKIKLCDPASGSATHELKGHKGHVLAVAWSPVSEYLLASASADNCIMLWDIRKAKANLHIFDQHNGGNEGLASHAVTSHDGKVNGITFLENGQRLISTGRDNKVRLWDVRTGHNELINYPKVKNKCSKKLGITVSNFGSRPYLFQPMSNSIAVIDIYGGSLLKHLRGHYSQVNTCCFHPFFHEMYSGSGDSEVLVWTPPLPASVAFDDTGNGEVGRLPARGPVHRVAMRHQGPHTRVCLRPAPTPV